MSVRKEIRYIELKIDEFKNTKEIIDYIKESTLKYNYLINNELDFKKYFFHIRFTSDIIFHVYVSLTSPEKDFKVDSDNCFKIPMVRIYKGSSFEDHKGTYETTGNLEYLYTLDFNKLTKYHKNRITHVFIEVIPLNTSPDNDEYHWDGMLEVLSGLSDNNDKLIEGNSETKN